MEEQIAALTKQFKDFENKIVLMANTIKEQKESIKRLEGVALKLTSEREQFINLINELSWHNMDTVKKRYKRGVPIRGLKMYWGFRSKTQEEYKLGNRCVKALFMK